GGELVPLARIEEALTEVVGVDADGAAKAAVVAVPDPAAGERLVVVHAPLDRSPAELTRNLAAAGLPTLFLPAPDSFVAVDRLPTTGSGKLDLKRIDAIARDALARRERRHPTAAPPNARARPGNQSDPTERPNPGHAAGDRSP
ncbi:MAG TPA: hypothetical protein VFQ80_01050, partial [Thermomicrobiales bacterium]|nr:hypothetical protein [Thermomicrobiales bacterium]